jgi:RNA polymerase sigma factor (sigma-70 family)
MMIQFAVRRSVEPPDWHARFLAMVPTIEAHARLAFRRLDPDSREDCVQEAVANALVAFVRLIDREKTDVAFPTALARFAVAQIRDGRRVGNRRNVREVLSPYAQKRKRFRLERLDRFDQTRGQWTEAVVEDRRTPVVDQVAFRCDFPDWLDSLPARDRQIAQELAVGHGTSDVAKRFGVSPGRISQLRREMHQSWSEFQNETFDDPRSSDNGD